MRFERRAGVAAGAPDREIGKSVVLGKKGLRVGEAG